MFHSKMKLVINISVVVLFFVVNFSQAKPHNRCNWNGCDVTDVNLLGSRLRVGTSTRANPDKFLGSEVEFRAAHVEGKDAYGEYNGNVLKGGGGAYLGWDGTGAKVDATLAEIGGKVGHGLLSVGGKLGLSADTGVVIGKNTELKLLGTGISAGKDIGFEACLFGSCIQLG